MIRIIVAVYKQNEEDFKPLVGVFQDSLEGKPLFTEELTLDKREPWIEKAIAAGINEIIGRLAGQDYTIDFFESVCAMRTNEKKVIFIKPGRYFSFDYVLMKLKL